MNFPRRPPAQQTNAEFSSDKDKDTTEEHCSSFDFGLIEPFVVAVKDAIQWEEASEPPAKSRKFKVKSTNLPTYGRNKGGNSGGMVEGGKKAGRL